MTGGEGRVDDRPQFREDLTAMPPEYPRLVSIETTSFCNAKCVFCPNATLKRGKMHMSDDLFEHIVDQLRGFPVPAIEPFLQGEPFSDPKILPRLERLRSRLPKTRLRLYSNAYALTPARTDELCRVGLDHLYISVNTLDPVKYEANMGLKLERTLENLRYLADPGRRARVARMITFRMLRLPTTTLREQDEFLDFCKRHGVRSFIVAEFNYAGDIASGLPVPAYPCEHIDRLDILSNGVVTLCCMDQDGDYAWGDATKTPLLDIYHGHVARRYRDMHRSGRRRDIAPCDRCNLFWPSFTGMALWRRALTAAQVGLYFARFRPAGRRAPSRTPGSPAI
jgi:MoaA/NifB/PqqE/SkfB family radical SAM enzyme